MSIFLDEEQPKAAHAFVQWKGTDLCMDFYCDCGAQLHFDGDFAYCVKCPHCLTVYEMPQVLVPRKADAKTYQYSRENPQLMEADEDKCRHVVWADGVTEAVPVIEPASPIDAPTVGEFLAGWRVKVAERMTDAADAGRQTDAIELANLIEAIECLLGMKGDVLAEKAIGFKELGEICPK